MGSMHVSERIFEPSVIDAGTLAFIPAFPSLPPIASVANAGEATYGLSTPEGAAWFEKFCVVGSFAASAALLTTAITLGTIWHSNAALRAAHMAKIEQQKTVVAQAQKTNQLNVFEAATAEVTKLNQTIPGKLWGDFAITAGVYSVLTFGIGLYFRSVRSPQPTP